MPFSVWRKASPAMMTVYRLNISSMPHLHSSIVCKHCSTLCSAIAWCLTNFDSVPSYRLSRNLQGNLGDSDNLRGITMSPIISKILEHGLGIVFSDFLSTSKSQFGFKLKAHLCLTQSFVSKKQSTIIVTGVATSSALISMPQRHSIPSSMQVYSWNWCLLSS